MDYYQLYCDYAHREFLGSLKLSESQAEVLALLTQQCDENNRTYIRKLAIEGLVHASNSPYEALRTLHILREKRIIFYELLETIPIEETHSLVDLAQQKAYAGVEVASEAESDSMEPGEAIEPPRLGVEMKRLKKFNRYAVLNVEYPVVYFALKEEEKFTEQWNPADLSLLYAAIRKDNLARALEALKLFAVLEFVQYVQTLFNQPLTQVNENETESPADV